MVVLTGFHCTTTTTTWDVRSSDMLTELGWLALDKKHYSQKKKLMSKTKNGKVLTYLEDLFRPKETSNQIESRDSIKKLATTTTP